jgi:predicted nucleic acid-binding protein
MIADSSFLVSLFCDSDSNHEKAKSLFCNSDDYILVPSDVMQEVFTYFCYKYSCEFALSISEQILTTNRFDLYFIDEREWFDIFDLVKKYKIKMSLVDYQVVYLSFIKSQPLLCFDKQIISLCKKLHAKS